MPAKPDVDPDPQGVGDRAEAYRAGSARPPRSRRPTTSPRDAGSAGHVGLAQVLADADDAEGVAEADIVHGAIVAERHFTAADGRFAALAPAVGIGRVAIMERLDP